MGQSLQTYTTEEVLVVTFMDLDIYFVPWFSKKCKIPFLTLESGTCGYYNTVKYVICALVLSPQESVIKCPPIPWGAGQSCDEGGRRLAVAPCSQCSRGGDVQGENPAGARHGPAWPLAGRLLSRQKLWKGRVALQKDPLTWIGRTLLRIWDKQNVET